MLAESYLLLDGVEVINILRTLTYLRRGLGPPDASVITVSPPVAEVGYSDTYSDAYTADPYWPGNLQCFCDLIDGGPYVSPAADPAPWYDGARPESGGFLGMVADVDLRDVVRRSVRSRSSGGASIGARGLGPRMVEITGLLYADSLAAMAWGRAWLAQTLGGPATGCGDATATVLPACPPDDVEGAEYLRELAEVGLADVPVYEQVQDVGACWVQRVAIQMAAGVPHLRLPAADCLGWSNLNADPTVSCALSGTALVGDTAARITVAAGQVGSSLRDLTITATRDSSCPSALTPFATYQVSNVPRGCELVIDSSTELVTVVDTASGEVIGGPDALDVSGAIAWVQAGPGEDICVEVDATSAALNPGSLVRVEAVGREV